MGQYFQLLQYLQFRAYLFLFLFVVTGLVTLFLVAYRPSWFTAILGISLCLIPINLVYLWTSFAIPRLEILFYSVSEDPSLIISSAYYDWFTLTIAILIVLIAGIQAFRSQKSVLRALAATAMFGAIALFPLGLEIYLFDRADWTNHVANIALTFVTNADLFYVSTIVLVLSSITVLFTHEKPIKVLR